MLTVVMPAAASSFVKQATLSDRVHTTDDVDCFSCYCCCNTQIEITCVLFLVCFIQVDLGQGSVLKTVVGEISNVTDCLGRTDTVQLGKGTLSSQCATRPCAAHALVSSCGGASAGS